MVRKSSDRLIASDIMTAPAVAFAGVLIVCRKYLVVAFGVARLRHSCFVVVQVPKLWALLSSPMPMPR
jgi:hypothetical protein